MICEKCKCKFVNPHEFPGYERKLCIECAPEKLHELENLDNIFIIDYFPERGIRNVCLLCNKKIREKDKKHWPNGRKICSVCDRMIYGKKNKRLAVEYKGGKCQICGYDKCISALDFHHRDSKNKKYNISELIYQKSWFALKKELDKCDLLCSNCHREKHYNKGLEKRWYKVDKRRKDYLFDSWSEYII